MLKLSKLAAVVVATVSLVACASTGLVSSWKAPDAQPLKGEGSKVAVVVMTKNESTRRAAEDALAQRITARGGQGVPTYTMMSTAEPDEAAAKAALEKAGVNAVVVLRPIGSEKEVYSTPTMYAGPAYGPYWGGYYGYGWGGAWGTGGGEIRTDTIVSVETLVYSMKQNKLVWAGQSKTTNPSKIDAFVKEIADAVAKEMKKQGLI
jgi:hypothetical protein